ncbi:MAG: recombinase family protein [Thermoplasmatota archaeon]
MKAVRVLLVGAVSRKDGDQDPENQLRPLRELAARRGWDAADELRFKQSRWDAESAGEVRAAVLERLRRGDVDVLAVWAWDRLSREGIEAAFAFLRDLEDHLGVRFFSLQEPFLCTDAPREQRELLLSILAWAARWESQRKSDRIVAKATAKRAHADAIGERAKWGKGRLLSGSEVLEVRRRGAAGESIRAIATALSLSKSQVQRVLSQGVKSVA